MKRLISCVWVFVIVACGGGGGGGTGSSTPAGATNAAPVSEAGNDVSQSLVPTDLVLDGSASSDPDGDTLSFSWAITAEPAGSSVSISDADKAEASFATSVPGQYEFTLTVTDPAGASARDSVSFDLSNDAPALQIASFIEAPMSGEKVQFSALGSNDVNGQMLSFTWEITAAPGGSAIARTYTDPAPVIQFYTEGRYQMRVDATDGFDTVSLTLPPIDVTEFSKLRLTEPLGDAVFDKTRERIVTIAGHGLSVIEKGEAAANYSLPLSSSAVALTPNGNKAVIGHDGWISVFSLNDKVMEATHAFPGIIRDIVADGDGFAYPFLYGSIRVSMSVMNIETGALSDSFVYPMGSELTTKLHPSGTKIYGATNSVSPTDLERYDIASGSISRAYDSPYHGDFPFCGDLWMGPGGNSILSRCGVVVRATDDPATDLTFMMQLSGFSSQIRHAASSAFNNVWYVLDGTVESVKIYGADSGFLIDTIDLPYVDDTATNRWQAKFVFATDTSDLIYILAEDDLADPLKYVLLKHHAVGPVMPNLPTAVVQRYTTTRQNTTVTLDASQSSDPESAPLVYAWTLVSEPAGSAISPSGADSSILQFTPAVAGTYELALQVHADGRTSAVAHASVNVFETTGSIVHRLPGGIADMEYSKGMNAVIYLSDTEPELHVLDLDDFTDTVVDLPRQGFRVGLSPGGGGMAAVSHSGMASFVSLPTGEVVDTQTYGEDWGDIVFDSNRRAHVIPHRDQWSNLVTVDFQQNQSSIRYGPYAGTQIRMHPYGLWIYGADVGLSPSDFEKWDASTYPPVYLGDSPYHGDYNIGGNIWISETGDKMLVVGGNAFHSSSEPAIDMTYAGSLPDPIGIGWADHSEETGEWALTTSSSADPLLDGKIIFYEDQFLNRSYTLPVDAIPSSSGAVTASAKKVFQSDNGSQVVVLLEAATGTDRFAIQITDTVP